MSAAPPRQARRRPRRGSLERPISGRTYRGTWLLVALPLLLAAFTVTRPAPLSKPNLPAAFDTQGARALAAEFANDYPDRSPGTAGASEAAGWFAKLKIANPAEVDALMDRHAYEAYLQTL